MLEMTRNASTLSRPLRIRGIEFGGEKPLFCIPLVPADLGSLTDQARVAIQLEPDLVEWRADFFQDATPDALAGAARSLRQLIPDTPVIFTLRVRHEGGAQDQPQPLRSRLIEAVLPLRRRRRRRSRVEPDPSPGPADGDRSGMRGSVVLLVMHNFNETPSSGALLGHIRAMQALGADIAKFAVMPRSHEDVLRVFEVTAAARREFPDLPLVTMAMGSDGRDLTCRWISVRLGHGFRGRPDRLGTGPDSDRRCKADGRLAAPLPLSRTDAFQFTPQGDPMNQLKKAAASGWIGSALDGLRLLHLCYCCLTGVPADILSANRSDGRDHRVAGHLRCWLRGSTHRGIRAGARPGHVWATSGCSCCACS